MLDELFVDASRPAFERMAVAVIWGRHRTIEKAPMLVDALDSSSIELVRHAALALARMGRSEGLEKMESTSRSSDPLHEALMQQMRNELDMASQNRRARD